MSVGFGRGRLGGWHGGRIDVGPQLDTLSMQVPSAAGLDAGGRRLAPGVFPGCMDFEVYVAQEWHSKGALILMF